MHLPKLVSWDEFEELTLASCNLRWNTSNLSRNGRQGQKQDGVDIFGHDDLHRPIGVQCKNTIAKISKSIVDTEIINAESFSPKISSLYIATSADSDVKLQKYVREISQKRLQAGNFTVSVLFWTDIVHDLSKSINEVHRFYPQFVQPNPQNSNYAFQASNGQIPPVAPQAVSIVQVQRQRDVSNLIQLLNGADVESISDYLNYAPKYIGVQFLDQIEYVNKHLNNPALTYYDKALEALIRNWAIKWNEIITLTRQSPYEIVRDKIIFNMPGDFVQQEYSDVYNEIDTKTSDFIGLNAEFCQWININFPEVNLKETSANARKFWAS